jgi:putative transposase
MACKCLYSFLKCPVVPKRPYGMAPWPFFFAMSSSASALATPSTAPSPSKVTRGYRVELRPNNVQKTAIMRHCGATRWVYNWGLSEKKAAYEREEKVLGAQKLDGVLRQKMDEVAPWLRDIASQARQGALADLDRAYKNFFNRLKEGKVGKQAGFPCFKSRKRGAGGFAVFSYRIERTRIRLAGIGWVRLKESGYLPTGGYGHNTEKVRFFGARVTERAGRFFVSVQVEEVVAARATRTAPRIEGACPGDSTPSVLGVHLGARVLGTDSWGRRFNNPKSLERRLLKLARLGRAWSRCQRGSRNQEKVRRRMAKLHATIADARRHAQHHLSHVVTRKPSVLGIETWGVAQMLQNKRVARVLADAGCAEIKRQILYKAQWRGCPVVELPQGFPSTRRCSVCERVHPRPIWGHKWTCRSCGSTHERETNAAHNLAQMASSMAEGGSGALALQSA